MSKKIVYVIGSLANKGGAERILTEKMNYLSSNGYDIVVITCFQYPETMPNVYALSDRIRQIDLWIPNYLQYRYKHPIRLWYRWKYHYQLLNELSRTINSIDPDILIGVSFSVADIVCKVKCRAVKIIESHNNRQFIHAGYLFSDIPFCSKVYQYLRRQIYMTTIEKHADIVVSLTKGDANEWKHAKRVEIIPNFSAFPISKMSELCNKRIIAVGRLEPQKGYDRLLEIWKKVFLRYPDWQLDIYGEGSLENIIRNQIDKMELKNVFLHPFASDISRKYSSSSIFVLASRYEGFSLAILEALRHGLPSVCFNCPFGPEDIIDNNKCGYLVENGDITEFAEKICNLIEHPEIRKTFSANAIEKSKKFTLDVVMERWITLFKNCQESDVIINQ